jgi:hypothetical protein
MDAPPPPPPAAPGLATPPLDPARWEDFEGFRETFLLNFTDPSQNATLRSLSRMLYHLILETAHLMPVPEEGWLRLHLRAAVADLRFLQGFLAFLGDERRNVALPEDEDDLCRKVSRKARAVGRIADGIEARLSAEIFPGE